MYTTEALNKELEKIKKLISKRYEVAFHLLCNDDAKYLSDSFDDNSWEYSRNEEGHIDNNRL